MQVGVLGDTVFEVSADRVLTFPEVEESGEARIEEHDVPLADPVAEFVGPGGRSVSLTVQLAAHLGVDPEQEISTLEQARDSGRLLLFKLGGRMMGGSGSYWLIKSLGIGRRTFAGDGSTTIAEVAIGLIRARTASTPAAISSTVAKGAVSRER